MEISTISSTERAEDFSEYYATDMQQKRWYHHLCEYLIPDSMAINLFVTHIFILVFFCLVLYGMLLDAALPGSEIFALLLLVFMAVIGGKIVALVKLPPLLGMMIVGFLYRNLEVFHHYDKISTHTIIAIREIALAFVLLRAGLGLDGEKLKTMKLIVIRLTIIPCLAEASSMTVLGHYLLGLPWIFSVMLGFLMSAISPEVVMPIVLRLEEQGYGSSKGIPTLIIAALSLDDILAIAGFMMCFSIAFSTANLTWTIIRGPLEPLVGLVYGAVLGVVFWYFPTHRMKRNSLIFYNVVLLSLGAIAAMFISEKLRIPGSGPLACISLAFVASIKFRKDDKQFHSIVSVMARIWVIIEPFLFSLIGAEITIKILKDSAGYGILSIFLGLIFRAFITFITCAGAGFNVKEKLFICCAWIAKATVQAAIGSQALDYARRHSLDKEYIRYATIVLNVSVLSILLTAPLGAALASLLGPVLLTTNKIPSEEELYHESSEAVRNSDPERNSDNTLLRKDSKGTNTS